MASTNLLNRIDSYVQTLFSDNKERVWNAAEDIADKFNLKLLSTVGTTRIVLKKKGSRTVIKVGYPSHNRAEYAAYKALECSVLGDLLAPCVGVSKPSAMRKVVVLPAPFAPRKPCICPSATSREISSTAVKSPNCFVAFLIDKVIIHVPFPPLYTAVKPKCFKFAGHFHVNPLYLN